MKVPSRPTAAAAALALVVAGAASAQAQPDNENDNGSAPSLTATDEAAGAAPSGPVSGAQRADEYWAQAESDTGLWIVQLDEPSAAVYGAQAQPDGALSPAEYKQQLATEHDSLSGQIDGALGRSVDVEYSYLNVLNGVAVEVSKDEAAALRDLPGVAEVYPDTERELETDVSHEVILSDAIWSGGTGPDVGTRGEGVLVAMIDSGVNPAHPSFAATDEEGYTHENPYGDGVYVGVCDPEDANYDPDFPCNAKLVGAHALYPGNPDANDDDGHGSHVGSTIAGNQHTAEFELGATTFEREVQGVAPRANVISYKVCSPSCPGTASIAAVDLAIDEGVDVLNYSISGVDDPWLDGVDLAFLDARAAGITVAASAGNSGPGPETVAKTGPWNLSVAASTHNRVFGNSVSVTSPEPPPELVGVPGFPGDGPAITEPVEGEVVDAEAVDPGNGFGCEPFEPGTFDASHALIQRGNCTFDVKVLNAQEAGAAAVVLYNNVGGPPTAPGNLATTEIPTVLITLAAGQALQAYVAENAPVTAEIGTEVVAVEDDAWTDIMAGFSSRGPSQFDLLAPTLAAPGVNILAAFNAVDGDPDQYGVISGTSMASPHAAGGAALLTDLWPDLSPTEIRSVLATTADYEGLLKEDGATPADHFDIGSGRMNLDQAGRAGLVMDETAENFLAANPATGGDPRTLNLPAFVDQTCQGVCEFTRTVESVSDAPVTYTAAVDSPEGIEITADPATFTLEPGATAEMTVSVDVSGGTVDEWALGRIVLEADGTHAGGAEVADVNLPVAVVVDSTEVPPEPPTITLDPEEITSEQPTDEVVTETLTIGNTGGADLEWEFVDDTGGEPVVLAEQAVNGGSGIVSDFFTSQDAGTFAAADFTLDEDAAVNTLYTPGFWNAGDVSTADAIDWSIHEDAGGAPGEAIWEYTSAPGEPGVTIEDNEITLDITEAGEEPGQLLAGTYWLSVWPTIPGEPNLNNRWNWYQGEDGGAEGHLQDLEGLFGPPTDWLPFSDVGLPFTDLAFRIDAPVQGDACGGDWISVDPTSGTTAPDGTTDVAVEIDSTGLEPGEYTTQLCLEANDPETPQSFVPVTLTVTDEEPPAAEVQRVAGEDRWLTAAEIAALFPDGTDTVYVANAEETFDGADALAGGAAAAVGAVSFVPNATPDGDPAPILLVKQGSIPDATLAAMQELAPSNAVILGGDTVISETVETQIEDLGVDATRVEGADRYDTAANLALEYAPGLETVYVATGQGDTEAGDGLALADALTAASLAGSQNAPVLLTRSDLLPTSTADALAELEPENIVLVGGTAAVNAEVEADLAEIAPTTRSFGDDRWGTAVALTQGYALDDDVLYVASGLNFPDALAGSSLTGSEGAPMLIVNQKVPDVVAEEVLRLSPQGITIVGGPEAVSTSVEEQLQELLDVTSTD